MATRIYGASDDLIEFEGDVTGEVGCYGTDREGRAGVLIVCSDGTLLEIKFGKSNISIWGITLLHKGTLLERIEQCENEDDSIYSDIAFFASGLRWAYAATEWEVVR